MDARPGPVLGRAFALHGTGARAVRERCACCLRGKRLELSSGIARDHQTLKARIAAANETTLVFGSNAWLTGEGKVRVCFWPPEAQGPFRCPCPFEFTFASSGEGPGSVVAHGHGGRGAAALHHGRDVGMPWWEPHLAVRRLARPASRGGRGRHAPGDAIADGDANGQANGQSQAVRQPAELARPWRRGFWSLPTDRPIRLSPRCADSSATFGTLDGVLRQAGPTFAAPHRAHSPSGSPGGLCDCRSYQWESGMWQG